MPEIKEFKNIAVIQTAFLGDVALALPLVQAIRNYSKDAIITFVTTPLAVPLVSAAKAVNYAVAFDKRNMQKGLKGIKSIAAVLKQKNIECIIAPHRSLRTTLIKSLAKPAFSVGFDRNALSRCYHSRIVYNRELHETERNLSLLRAFSDYSYILRDSNISVELDIAHSDIDYIRNLLSVNAVGSGPYVVLAPGSVWNTKRWKEEHYIELAKQLPSAGLAPVLTGSKSDQPLCNLIADRSGAVNLSGMTTLPQSIALLSSAGALVTNDSAPTHLAGLAGCPTITIFGPTVPAYGFAPRGKNDRVVEIEGLKCRPCRIHGSNRCPVRTHECMTSITPERVLMEVLSVIAVSGQSENNLNFK